MDFFFPTTIFVTLNSSFGVDSEKIVCKVDLLHLSWTPTSHNCPLLVATHVYLNEFSRHCDGLRILYSFGYVQNTIGPYMLVSESIFLLCMF